MTTIPYFTYDATKKHSGIEFDPVSRSGSQLFGIARLTPEQVLLLQGNKFTKEISEEDYETYLKKKVSFVNSKNVFQLQDRTNALLPQAGAAPAARPANLGFDAAAVLAPRKVK